jgi:hypothetical protein
MSQVSPAPSSTMGHAPFSLQEVVIFHHFYKPETRCDEWALWLLKNCSTM